MEQPPFVQKMKTLKSNAMKQRIRTLFSALLSLGLALAANGQEIRQEQEQAWPRWSMKTNLLYDATTTLNLGAEFRTGERTSFDIPVSYNPWTFGANRKWKHAGAQPELRWWPRGTFDRHFWGVHGHYAFYNVGKLPDPFSEYMKVNRFEGWLAGAGLSYGYRWNFRDSRWAIEATLGVGYAYKSFDRFACGECGEKLSSGVEHYFGPTKAGLSLIFNPGKRHESAPVLTVIVPPRVSAPVIYEPVLRASFIVPEAEAVKSRAEVGRAYLDFVVNRAEIVPDFRNNAVELQKIYASIESVRSNPDATITGIGITGYASPEGRFKANESLSERRAEALRNHIGATYGLPNSLFAVWGGGEDWAMLDSLVIASTLAEKRQLIEVIRSGGDADVREGRLKAVAGGVPYRQILTDYYPDLRRSDYRIGYTVIPFTVEQGKQVMKTRPGTLSLNEMFLIANTYAPGSDAFNGVFETAVRVFPESDVANLNAAASALERKEAASAERYLARVREHTSEYWNNMGLLRWLQGDKDAAAAAFARAGAVGVKNAAELDRHLRTVR